MRRECIERSETSSDSDRNERREHKVRSSTRKPGPPRGSDDGAEQQQLTYQRLERTSAYVMGLTSESLQAAAACQCKVPGALVLSASVSLDAHQIDTGQPRCGM